MKYKLLLLLCIGALTTYAQNNYRLMLQSGTMQPAVNAEAFINETEIPQSDLFNGYYYRRQ